MAAHFLMKSEPALTVSFDTNLVIYAHDPRDAAKQETAIGWIDALVIRGNGVLAAQVLGEFMAATHRKRLTELTIARDMVDILYRKFTVLETDRVARRAATELAEQHGMQFFDALICTVVARGGATLLLSEDMQDGRIIDGLTILNPFNPVNAEVISAAIGV